MLKWLLAVLVGTTTYSFALLGAPRARASPTSGSRQPGGLVLVSLILFLLFLDRFLHRLRPVAVAAFVAAAGRRAFEDGVAAAASLETPDVLPPGYQTGGRAFPRRPEHRRGRDQALDGRGLVSAMRVQTDVG